MSENTKMMDKQMIMIPVKMLSVDLDDSKSVATINLDYDGLAETWTVATDNPITEKELTDLKGLLNTTYTSGGSICPLIELAFESATSVWLKSIVLDSDIEHREWTY